MVIQLKMIYEIKLIPTKIIVNKIHYIKKKQKKVFQYSGSETNFHKNEGTPY